MKLYVDADACPVVDTIIDIANKFSVSVVLVRSFDHFSIKTYPTFVENVYVDKGFDAADYKIIQLAKKGDVIITQDYGLAALALPKGCHVLHHKGFIYTKDNIDNLLIQRYASALKRQSGIRTKGPKPFKSENREHFRTILQELLTTITKT